ncbi:hypothetical protein SDC9_36049 [bioreactor metagenome]|jgi:hypothetical protein|uniref:N-acetyltransferase domain-containing protein n=1 Tax=bioreactor metagenome TaxID=1076179 RepID=A0A644VF26_9ZZZZ|nr:hypothetical protein [Lentimicrobium sp.]MEA5112122.1 hypothetical protein [Lentimicrobium sp.]
MKRKLLVYSKSSSSIDLVGWPNEYIGFKLIEYKPGFGNFSRYGLSWKVNFLWYLFSRGNFSILILMDEKLVVHYSYLTPKVFRFPFMRKGDVQVGPCVTHASFRGKGVFSKVLELVPLLYPRSETIWTYTTEDDIAAQKAFKNAGYSFITFAEMSLRTKIVRLIK